MFVSVSFVEGTNFPLNVKGSNPLAGTEKHFCTLLVYCDCNSCHSLALKTTEPNFPEEDPVRVERLPI